MDAEKAWEAARPRVAAMTSSPSRLPTWRFDGLREPLKAELSQMSSTQNVYNEASAARFEALMAQVDQLSLAGLWALSQYERDDTAQTRRREVISRAQTLRTRGLRALQLLTLLGHVSQAEFERIRRGQGYANTAGDLQAIAPLLRKHQEVLSQTQARSAEGADALQPEDVEAMPAAAEALLTLTLQGEAATEVDWHDALRRLSALITTDWERLRLMHAGALAALDAHTNLSLPRPTLLSLFRS